MAVLTKIEGVGPAYAADLKKAGVSTTTALLEVGATPAGRRELALATGISEANILRWVNQADLHRINGVGEEYGELLEAAGVDTVMELARRNADSLLAAMEQVNARHGKVRKMPSERQVQDWIGQAKLLPRTIMY